MCGCVSSLFIIAHPKDWRCWVYHQPAAERTHRRFAMMHILRWEERAVEEERKLSRVRNWPRQREGEHKQLSPQPLRTHRWCSCLVLLLLLLLLLEASIPSGAQNWAKEMQSKCRFQPALLGSSAPRITKWTTWKSSTSPWVYTKSSREKFELRMGNRYRFPTAW